MGIVHLINIIALAYSLLGQLGDNSQISRALPVAVDASGYINGKTIVAIAASGTHSHALDSQGNVYSWGSNNNGQLGNHFC
jgi:alpha-tubulin suppressor-like RCC1 family protein